MADYVFIGDDFTGASDTLATLSERGVPSRLFMVHPTPGDAAGLDAVGIATDLRARTPGEIAERLAVLGPVVSALSPRIVHYKVCSTFDSAPHVGSIGQAVLALEAALSPSRTIVLGGQPSLGRYCFEGTLFARAPDGGVHRIDRHPIMSRHPVTPMAEADLRRHLANQGLEGMALLPHRALGQPLDEIARSLQEHARILADAADGDDIDRLGQALRGLARTERPLLVVGASSVAEAVYPAPPRHVDIGDAAIQPVPGPRLVIAGSRSAATATQVERARSFAKVPLDRASLAVADALAGQCASMLANGTNVLVHLQPDADYGLSATELSEWIAALAADILTRQPVGAIAVAGGDTSSAVVQKLGFRSLSFETRAGSGVAICRGHAPGSTLDRARLLLKGGQVGEADLFERFATG
ncbi:four-carbon acid sugar kinase family protein [Mesorhizobium sp. CAU 1741]|uniref:four-carbon acid sugar kinase family protein n=1 Tax=Mesorhizobium sp. CAU 1741 TaxID=3140366 RepID=UPI00325AE419